MNETHKLSDELVACRTQVGVMLHQCVQSADCPDEMTADGQPGMPLVALGHQEMLELIAWYCREEATPNGDLIAFALQLVVAGAIKERTATVALRALMARSAAEAVDAALMGWVMPELEEYVSVEEYPWYSCGNCHRPWPCGCDDPARICGICGGDQFECNCDERSYWRDGT